MKEPEAAMWMRRFAELSRNESARNEAALPDPALIWWQARLLERQDVQARAARPIAIAQWVSLVVAVVSVIALCAVYSQGIRGMLAPLGVALWMVGGGGAILMGLALRVVFGQ
ncbi:MAG: hypothetical protein ABSH32_05410 [Bryobacteraceae bacterium]|jgi:hypothetical protein